MSSELFERWVLVPLEALRSVPDGDGAFGALAMTFGLYERFLSSRIQKRGGSANDDEKYAEASADFDGNVTPEDFKKFWEMYRVGVQHYFHPKNFTKGKDQTRWGWDMSEAPEYKPFPVVVRKEAGLFIITINPWAFADHVVRRWKEHPDLFDELSATRLGEVRPAPKSDLKPPSTSYNSGQSTYIETPVLPAQNSTGKWPG